MDKSLERWEYAWNYVRPHQSLNYLTPDEYLQRIQITNLTPKEAIILQTWVGNIYLNLLIKSPHF